MEYIHVSMNPRCKTRYLVSISFLGLVDFFECFLNGLDVIFLIFLVNSGADIGALCSEAAIGPIRDIAKGTMWQSSR